MPREKRVVKDIYFSDIPKKASEFIEFWNNKIAEIPPDSRESATISIEIEYEYSRIELAYYRPETEEEVRARWRKEEADAAMKEEHDRMLLAQLKATYEGGS